MGMCQIVELISFVLKNNQVLFPLSSEHQIEKKKKIERNVERE
jgi:hypothetical protein